MASRYYEQLRLEREREREREARWTTKGWVCPCGRQVVLSGDAPSPIKGVCAACGRQFEWPHPYDGDPIEVGRKELQRSEAPGAAEFLGDPWGWNLD